MRPSHYIYRLFILAAAALSMSLLMKINKMSFYHHYFKVIEEVEVRNSQEVGSALFTFNFREVTPRAFFQLISFFVGLGLFASLLSIILLAKVSPFESSLPIPSQESYYLLPPIRAP